MILAAGLGRRMRPLTDTTPKPLLRAGGKPLLQYHLEALRDAGAREVIINLAYRGEQIRAFVGDGSAFGLSVTYSPEPEPLETGGAIRRALPLLGESPFLLVNGDVWSDYPLGPLLRHRLPEDCDGHLLLVPNPDFHPEGDFALDPTGRLRPRDESGPAHTYAGISLLRPQLVAHYPRARTAFPLLEALQHALTAGRLTGELHTGAWSDVGTPERLAALDQVLRK